MYVCSSTCPRPQRGNPRQSTRSPAAAATGDWDLHGSNWQPAATNYSRDRRRGRGHTNRRRLGLGRCLVGGEKEGSGEREDREEEGAMENNKPGGQKI